MENKIKNGRNWIGGKRLAHVVWNEHNPDNPYRIGYNVAIIILLMISWGLILYTWR